MSLRVTDICVIFIIGESRYRCQDIEICISFSKETKCYQPTTGSEKTKP